MDLTVVIPTFRRAPFVHRLLDYYERAGFEGTLLIGDASPEEASRPLAERAAASPLRVDYHCWPGVLVGPTLIRLAERIETGHAVICGDDDLLIPAGVQACLDALAADPGASGVVGEARFFTQPGDAPEGPPTLTARYGDRSLDGATARERLTTLLGHYWVTLYAITRADVWRSAWAAAAPLTDERLGAELLPACLIAAAGRVPRIAAPTLLRQTHGTRTVLPPLVDWVTRADFAPSYTAFETTLTDAVASTDGLPDEQHEAIARDVRDAFGHYLEGRLAAPPPVGAARRSIRRARRAWRLAVLRGQATGPWREALGWLAAAAPRQ